MTLMGEWKCLEGRWELDDTYGRVEVLRVKVGT